MLPYFCIYCSEFFDLNQEFGLNFCFIFVFEVYGIKWQFPEEFLASARIFLSVMNARD